MPDICKVCKLFIRYIVLFSVDVVEINVPCLLAFLIIGTENVSFFGNGCFVETIKIFHQLVFLTKPRGISYTFSGNPTQLIQLQYFLTLSSYHLPIYHVLNDGHR